MIFPLHVTTSYSSLAQTLAETRPVRSILSSLLAGAKLAISFIAAFALSSGTIGAALSSSLSKTRAIALSYGTVHHPTPPPFFHPAHALSARIIQHLWSNWGADEGGIRKDEIDLYNVNIPMIEGLLSEEGLPITWTRIWRNSYGRLFKAHSVEQATALKRTMSDAGPDGMSPGPSPSIAKTEKTEIKPEEAGDLVFKFAPEMGNLINPSASDVTEGSDGWAIRKGLVSVTPMRASFAEPPAEEIFGLSGGVDSLLWKFKL